MKKAIKYTLRIAGSLGCLLLLAWLLLAGYIFKNKASLLKKAQTEIKLRFGGDAAVGDWDISFFRHFPSITLHMSKVSLRDSLWQQHHHDLLQAQQVDVSLSPFRSLLARKVRISKVYLQHGAIYFFTDTAGYTNKYLLREKPASAKNNSKDNEADPPDIILSDIKWTEEKQDKHKLFALDVRRLSCSIHKDDRTLFFQVEADIRANSFAFNTEKGSFIKDKALSGRFAVQYNTGSKILQFSNVTLRIDGHPFVFSGRFFPTVSPDPFSLTIETKNIRFKTVAALLTPNLRQKLDQYDVDQPVAVQALIDAGSADDRTPLLSIHMNLDKANVLTPAGRFNNCSFRASFTNEWVHGHQREDENSALRLLSFSGEKETIGFKADTLLITNLKHPILASDIHARFDLTRLNELSGSQTLQFEKGSCNANLFYKGPLSENDSTATSLAGTIDLDSAAIKYLPYNFLLSGINGRLLFKDQDLVIDHLDARTGSTKIRVKGSAAHLVTLLDRNAPDVSMDWSLSSSHLDVRDFSSLAGRASETTQKKSPQAAFGSVAARIDRLLKDGVIHLRLEAADLRYEDFSGVHAKADLLFKDHEIKVTDMIIQQGNGSLRLKADLNRQPGGNASPLTLESHLEQVDLPKLFTSFDNFGQQALLNENLKGSLTADIHMSGLLTNKAQVAPNSLKGTIHFNIKNGRLLDFEPMEKINEKVLKKRDLSDIKFSELSNQIDLDTSTFTIHRMEIQSTAITVFVEGTYDLRSGPDFSVQVPLSNLKERNPDIPPANKGNDGKTGLSVRLRARRGDEGKLKVSWDPFKKALKKGKGQHPPTG